jgi:RNA polymerase sigma-70 factor (ECF subfamily)
MDVQTDHHDCAASPFDDVVQRNREWLVRVISSRTGSQALVEDVLQEVGLAVARSAQRVSQDEELRPWLCKITIRQCALALRNAQRQRRLLEGAAENELDAESRLDDPIYWLLDRERSGLVREALATMDEEKRTLLIWKYVDGMTYSQLADRLRVPAHVVEYRVVTAKKALRRLLIDRGIGEEDLP